MFVIYDRIWHQIEIIVVQGKGMEQFHSWWFRTCVYFWLGLLMSNTKKDLSRYRMGYASDCYDLVTIWQFGLWSFQTGGTKLGRFLPKNQRKLLNFENWISGSHRALIE